MRSALRYFEPDAHRSVRLHLELGRAEEHAGRIEAARQHYLAGIERFEEQRTMWSEAATRASSFDEAWALFDAMVRLHAADASADPRTSLEFAERGRTAALLESGHPGLRAHRATIDAVQAALPRSVDVVFYTTFDERLLLWYVSRESVVLRTSTVSRGQLDTDIRRFVDALNRADGDGIRWRGRRLYDTLLAPIASELRAGAQLVVVGDAPIQRVPMAALWTPAGRFLIEERAVAWAPNLSLLAEPVGPRAPLDRAHALVVSVASSVGATLSFAGTEGRRVGDLYPQAWALSGADATAAAFLARAPLADVIHFAGHGIANRLYPALSYLQLTPHSTPSDAGRVFEPDIAGLSLGRTRLVVLAACGTAVGRAVHGEGVLSLTRPFLSAGASAVVSTLWDIDDRDAERFFVRFHEHYRTGLSPADALRRAQIEMLSSGDSHLARTWATVILTGRAAGLFPHE
jgi:CHAT domain-containing protein